MWLNQVLMFVVSDIMMKHKHYSDLSEHLQNHTVKQIQVLSGRQ